MTEPIYSFVPGKGWVVCSARTFMWRGELWKIEHRHPNMGELFEYVYTSNLDWLIEDGTPKFEKFISHVKETGSREYTGMSFSKSDVVVAITKA